MKQESKAFVLTLLEAERKGIGLSLKEISKVAPSEKF
jgi:hypothetical protein